MKSFGRGWRPSGFRDAAETPEDLAGTWKDVAKDAADAKTKLHQNPRLILHVESAHNRSRFESASHFDQTNVKRNKVVYDTKNGEKYYDDVTRTAQKM